MPPVSAPEAPAAEAAAPADPVPPSPRPRHQGLVVTGAQRWPWYDDRASRHPSDS